MEVDSIAFRESVNFEVKPALPREVLTETRLARTSRPKDEENHG
jgi:hypothetical protein